MKWYQFVILIAGACSGLSASAQVTRDVAEHKHTWFMAFGNHRLSDALGLHMEYQFRRTDFGQDWQQSLMRVGLDWHRSKNHLVTAGYGWIRSFPYGEQPIAQLFDEHRVWQQLITKSKTGDFNWIHRYRLEQRYMNRQEAGSWQHRARYFVQISWSIPNHRNWSITGYEEVFIGLRNVDQPVINLLQQNRLSSAINYRFEKGTSVQVGWLQQSLWKGDGKAERNQTLLIGVRHDLDLRK